MLRCATQMVHDKIQGFAAHRQLHAPYLHVLLVWLRFVVVWSCNADEAPQGGAGAQAAAGSAQAAAAAG
jgi:hypothetical protein